MRTCLLPLTTDNKVAILLQAHKKHSTEFLAIEHSQEKLQLLVLTIYAAGMTLVGTLHQGGGTLSWPLVATLSGASLLLAFYALKMGSGRNGARRHVRRALVQVDHALGFFEPDCFLKGKTLYPLDWKDFANVPTFLGYANWLIVIAAFAFIATIATAAVWPR